MFIVSAALAAYTAGALMIAAAWGRTVLPVGELHRGPTDRMVAPLEYELGEPGVKRGQRHTAPAVTRRPEVATRPAHVALTGPRPLRPD